MLTRKRKPKQSDETEPSHRLRNSKDKRNVHLEELHPLTVETIVCDEGGLTSATRQSQINLLSFCVFCLRKTTATVNQSNVPPPLVLNREDVSSKELLEDVPRASFLGSSSQLLSTFNRIWDYLGKGKQGVELNEEPLLHLLQESEANRKSRIVFLHLPRICVPCAANLQTVHKLFMELKAQLDGIQRIIKDSKYSGRFSWRAKHFEKVLTTSYLEQQVIAATLETLDKLGRNDSDEMNATGTQRKPESSSFVQVFSADNSSGGNFIDEDDDWFGDGSDPSDYVKSEKLVENKSTLDTDTLHKADAGNGEKDNMEGTSAPVTKTVQTVAESTILRHMLSQTSIQENRAASAAVPTCAKFLPGPPPSSFAEVASADDSFSGKFVDEDEDWNGNESDPDHIKSEPEEDFSEEQGSSQEDDDLEEWTPPRKRRKVKSRKEISVQSDSAVEKKAGHQCDQCEQEFLLAYHLRNHKRLAHADGKSTKDKCVQMCDLCNETVALNDIRAHVREHVGNEFLIPCPNPTCPFTFSKPSALYKHLASYKQKTTRCTQSASVEFLMARYTKCQECGQRLSDRRYANRHLLSRHENSTKNFSCPINGCYQQFTARQSVQFHMEAHQLTSVFASGPPSTQTCTQCDATFELEKIENHLKEAHRVGAEDVIKCAYCPFKFPTREQLVDHLFEHSSSVLNCDICGDDQVKFPLYLELREHYGNVHNVGKRFPCEHCNYMGWTQNALEQHAAKEHERHQCDLCGKSYSNLSGLQKHKQEVHFQQSGKALPQMCDLCRKTIPVEQMRAHVREHVGDEYLIPCPNSDCKYVYWKPYSLYKHLVLQSKRCSKSVSNLEEILAMAKGNKCQECEYQTKRSYGLRHHLLREHENSTKNFSCPIENCHEKFTAKQSVQFHIATHIMRREPEPLTTQKCSECDATFELEEMENHLKEIHGIGAEEVIKCAHCPFVFPTRQQLVDHLYEHRSSVLSCDICGDQVKFSKHARLREHYFISHSVGKRFECEHCSLVCHTQKTWKEHMAKKHKQGEMTNEDAIINVASTKKQTKKSYKCDVCEDAAYICKSDLQDHKIKVHGAEAYNCKICTATFLVRKHLLKHEKEHAAIKFTCEVEGCGKSFKLNCFLKDHMSTAHRGERPHVCELCGKSYAQAQGLKNHNDVVHLGLRSHVCDTCGESFTNGSSLKRHKLIHTGERPFGCDICGQRFRHKEVLKTHVEGHRKKGADFKPNGSMKQVRKRVEKKGSTSM